MSALDTDPGTELFSSYEADFKLVFTDIEQKLEQIPEVSGEARRAAIRAAERAVDEADEIVGQMSLEINNIPSTSRSKVKSRLRQYTAGLDNTRSSLLKFSQNADRDALFGNRGGQQGGAGDAVNNQRQQLLSGTQRLQQSTDMLTRSERMAHETEAIGGSILEDLAVQRNTIGGVRDTLDDSDRYLDRSIKTLRGMARRMATNRMITIAIITVLVLLIILVIVSKFR
ncbi:t-SNARE [Geopyxis carbonaria]|nr:t-SNARE [Geopyxis carbonaria]